METYYEFQKVKADLAAYEGVRTVKVWNKLRQEIRQKYGENVIGRLDSSGYIVRWLDKLC